MEENILYHRGIKFHDKENMLVISELKITDNKNGYPEFSRRTEKNGGYGQTPFIPQGQWQKKLNTIWSQYHLNGMNAGLPIQQEAITEWEAKGNEYDYDKAIEYLKEIKLYEIPLKANLPKGFFISGKEKITAKETYKYGCGWIHCILPNDFIKTLDEVCDEIENEERERYAEADKIEWNDIEDKKVIALGQFLGIEPIEAQEDITKDEGRYSNNCQYSYSGIDYLICTDEEATKEARISAENIIEECYLTKEIKESWIYKYFDMESAIDDVASDRGSELGRYDGCENEQEVNGITYYIYKQ